MNLIICTTPFQMLLAEKIIELYPDEEFIFKAFCLVDNDKHRYYYERLKNNKQVIGAEFIHCYWGNKLQFLFFLFKIKLFSTFSDYRKVNKIFIGSIDNNHIHIHIHHIIHRPNIALYTFDDGTANINKQSFFYKETTFSNKLRIIRKLLCPHTNLAFLKSISKKHYTVYKDKDNIIPNIEYLDILQGVNKVLFTGIEDKVEKRFLIGQPIFELAPSDIYSEKMHINYLYDIINNMKIDYYLPHPREKYILDNVNYVESNLIAEEYFIELIRKGEKIKIFTFFSGAVLSFVDFDNVEIVSLLPKILKESFSEHYQLIKSFNVPIMEINYE